jgi:hypothetical protein
MAHAREDCRGAGAYFTGAMYDACGFLGRALVT